MSFPATPAAPVVPAAPIAPNPEINGGEDDDASLSDHEAQFGDNTPSPEPRAPEPVADAADPPADPAEPKPAKHRAKSQQAAAGDVPRINELTKKWRDAEARATAAETKLKTQAPAAPPVVGAPKPPDPSKPFEFAEFDDWQDQPANKGKSWGTYQNARDDARDTWREAKSAGASTATTRAEADAARKEADQTMLEVWNERMGEFKKTNTDVDALLVAADKERGDMPDLLGYVLVSDDNGVPDLYTLLRNPAIFDEMIAFTVDRPVTEKSVAATRRLLKTRLQAAPTGSAGSRKQAPIAPRPPNPVRTGPLKTGDDLPDDESSLAEHEKAFGDRGPRRR